MVCQERPPTKILAASIWEAGRLDGLELLNEGVVGLLLRSWKDIAGVGSPAEAWP